VGLAIVHHLVASPVGLSSESPGVEQGATFTIKLDGEPLTRAEGISQIPATLAREHTKWRLTTSAPQLAL